MRRGTGARATYRVKGKTKGRIKDRGTPPKSGCQYPPTSAAQVSLTGRDHSHGWALDLNGKVSQNNCPVNGSTVALYSSHDGTTNWVLIQKATVKEDGTFVFTIPGLATHYYKAVALQGSTEGGISGIVKVERR